MHLKLKNMIAVFVLCLCAIPLILQIINAADVADNTNNTDVVSEEIASTSDEVVKSEDLDFITIDDANKVLWLVSSPYNSIDDITISYNSFNNYICNCGGYISDYERINIRTEALTPSDVKKLEETGECSITQPETPKLLEENIEDIIDVIRYESTSKNADNVDAVREYLTSLYEDKFYVEDVLTAYSIYDADGTAYPLHAVWECYESDSATHDFKRLQAAYIEYKSIRLVFRFALNYNMYDFWFIKHIENGGMNSLSYDYDTLTQCLNADTTDDVKSILTNAGYCLNLNTTDCIFKQTAPEYLYGLQADIVIGDYVK